MISGLFRKKTPEDMLEEKEKILIKILKKYSDKGIEIIFHDDGDGICSAAIMSKVLEKLGIKHELRVSPPDTSQISDNIPRIFLDITPKRDGSFIVIDHHMKNRKTNFEFEINFYDIFGKAGSNSFFLSLMLKNIINIHPSFFVLTAMQDGAFGELREDLKRTIGSYYDILVPRDFPGLYSLILYFASNAILIKRDIWEKELELLKEAVDVGIPVIGKPIFWELYEIFNKGLKEALRSIKGIKNYGKNLSIIWLENDSTKLYRISIAYIMSTVFTEVKVFLKRKNSRTNFSIRSYKKDLYPILEDISKELEMEWGGHKRAIGGWIKKEDEGKFLELLKNRIIEPSL